jgi:uncharacterized membrane protein
MTLRRNGPYWLLTAGCFLWLAAVFFAAYARGQGLGGFGVLYGCFGSVCHQIPERSFSAFGAVLPVCHRCLGLYTGFTVGLLVFPYLHRWRAWLLGNPRWVLLFIAPMFVDVFLLPNTYLTRYLTGFSAAFPVALLAWGAAAQLFDQPHIFPRGEHDEQRVTR